MKAWGRGGEPGLCAAIPRSSAVALLATLALLAGSCGTAGAKPSFKVQEGSLRLSLDVKGSNGFRGFISTKGRKQVTLTLLRGDQRIETRASGRVTRRAVVARFGDLGRVSVRFQSEPASVSLPILETEGAPAGAGVRSPNMASSTAASSFEARTTSPGSPPGMPPARSNSVFGASANARRRMTTGVPSRKSLGRCRSRCSKRGQGSTAST